MLWPVNLPRLCYAVGFADGGQPKNLPALVDAPQGAAQVDGDLLVRLAVNVLAEVLIVLGGPLALGVGLLGEGRPGGRHSDAALLAVSLFLCVDALVTGAAARAVAQHGEAIAVCQLPAPEAGTGNQGTVACGKRGVRPLTGEAIHLTTLTQSWYRYSWLVTAIPRTSGGALHFLGLTLAD